MSEMTVKQALDRVEELTQHVSISLPAHIQIKQVIESVRQEAQRSLDGGSPAPKKGK